MPHGDKQEVFSWFSNKTDGLFLEICWRLKTGTVVGYRSPDKLQQKQPKTCHFAQTLTWKCDGWYIYRSDSQIIRCLNSVLLVARLDGNFYYNERGLSRYFGEFRQLCFDGTSPEGTDITASALLLPSPHFSKTDYQTSAVASIWVTSLCGNPMGDPRDCFWSVFQNLI